MIIILIQFYKNVFEENNLPNLNECDEQELNEVEGDGMYVTDPELGADYVKQVWKDVGGGEYEVTTTYYNFEVCYSNGHAVYMYVKYYVTVQVVSSSSAHTVN